MNVNHLFVSPETDNDIAFLKSKGIKEPKIGDNYKLGEADYAEMLDQKSITINGFTREVYQGE